MNFEFLFFLCVFVFADKDRELSEAQAEIKALRLSERLREKAVEEVTTNFSIIVNCFCSLFVLIDGVFF